MITAPQSTLLAALLASLGRVFGPDAAQAFVARLDETPARWES